MREARLNPARSRIWRMRYFPGGGRSRSRTRCHGPLKRAAVALASFHEFQGLPKTVQTVMVTKVT